MSVERADRLVRVRHADQERRPRPATDREQLDRPALGRGADGLETCDPGEFGDQPLRARAELFQGEELLEVRHPREQPGEVEHVAS